MAAQSDGVPWQTLAGLLELDERTIRGLAQEGVFVKAGRNNYVLAQSVRNYVRKLREIAAGRQGDQLNAVDENARLKIVQRKNYELKNAALEGSLIPMDDILEAWGSITRTIKTMVLSFPARCQEKLPHLKYQDVEAIHKVVHKLLTEMSKMLPDKAPIPQTGIDLHELEGG
jgi:phage terminase Nu1 subunit (DNA packaging protein)